MKIVKIRKIKNIKTTLRMPLEKKGHWRGSTGLLDRRQTKYNPAAAAVTSYLQSVGALQSADTGYNI